MQRAQSSFGALLGLVVCLSPIWLLANAGVPHTFVDGQVALAADVNANFAALGQSGARGIEWAHYSDAEGGGSSATKIWEFKDADPANDTGTVITVANDSVNGLRVTALRRTFVSVHLSTGGNAGGFSVDASAGDLTTQLQSIGADVRRGYTSADGAVNAISWAGVLEKDQVLRPHGNTPGTSTIASFTVTAIPVGLSPPLRPLYDRGGRC